MNAREQRKLLKQAGFWFDRMGTRHDIWTNGKDTVPISYGAGRMSPNVLWSFKSKMRKAIKQSEYSTAIKPSALGADVSS